MEKEPTSIQATLTNGITSAELLGFAGRWGFTSRGLVFRVALGKSVPLLSVDPAGNKNSAHVTGL